MTELDARAARRRFLILTAFRWLPTGFAIPIYVLLPLSRGLSLTEIGLVFSVQGLVVLALELPTGGLADSLGRRPVLILASLLALASLGVLIVADTVLLFIVSQLLQGIYRALDSGPLEAWYVDATLAADPDARLEGGLSAGTTALSLALAGGALASGGLIALRPIPGAETLAVPLFVSFILGVGYLVAILTLMDEVRIARGVRAVAASVAAVPRVIGEGIRMLRGSRVLLALVSVELFWGFSIVAFESLFPIRLAELVGGTTEAGAIMGPVSSGAWFAAAAGSAGIGLVSRRIGVARSAAALRVIQGITIVVMGLVAGPVGAITAYLACYITHGASNPMHTTLLHREVDGPRRTTILSMNSMVAQPAGSIGAIVLASIADGASVSTAMVLGGIVCAVAAPLYLPALRAERRRAAVTGGAADRAAEFPAEEAAAPSPFQ